MHAKTRLIILCSVVSLLTACAADTVHQRPGPAGQQPQSTPRHLVLLRSLESQAQPSATTYQHSPTQVDWPPNIDGTPAIACYADCSGLLNELFKSSLAMTDEDLSKWLGAKRPLASAYYNAITTQSGFERITHVQAVTPGDIIAIRYERGAGNSGHVMVVDALPFPAPQNEGPPSPLGATAWDIPVIDCSSTGHGPGDTRWSGAKRIRTGLGRGVFRLYTDSSGVPVAHAFTIEPAAPVRPMSLRPVAIGRLTPEPQRRPRRRHGIHEPSVIRRRATHGLHSSACRSRVPLRKP